MAYHVFGGPNGTGKIPGAFRIPEPLDQHETYKTKRGVPKKEHPSLFTLVRSSYS